MRTSVLFALFASAIVGCADIHLPSGYESDSGAGIQVVEHTDVNGVSTWAWVPSSYSETQENSWVIYDHGFGQTVESILQKNPQRDFVRALASAGFVVVASEYRDLACWGNESCTEDIANLQSLWHSQLNLTPQPFVIGESMGGIVTWNAISRGILSPLAVVGIYPACDLAVMDQNPIFVPTIESAFAFTAQSGYAAATQGYDPMLTPASDFVGFPIAIWSSYSDHVVVRSLNEDPFAHAIRAAGGKATIHSSTGEHGDPSNFDPPSVISFFKALAH